MGVLRLNAHWARVFALLLLCSVTCWVVLLGLLPHVEVFARHVGFNPLEDETVVERPRLADVYRGDFRDPRPSLCPNDGVDVDLLVIVPSSPRNFDKRMAVRQTWGQHHRRRNIVVGFMVGVHSDPEVSRMIDEENVMHGDVILNNNVESYHNLALKTASIFEWTTTYCSEAGFVLKCDDDMFVNIPRLLGWITDLPETGRLLYGRLAENVRPERYRFSKYFISDKSYGPHVFPAFLTGGAYLTTPGVALRLYEAALNFTYLSLEDVFFTGVVARQVGFTLVDVPEITNKPYVFHRNPCLVHKAITYQCVRVDLMHKLWDYLLDKRRWC